MRRIASSRSCEAQTNAVDRRSLAKFPDQEATPTLESLPRELKLQICREMLCSEKHITLSPCTPYVSGFAFGSLGLLRVSKDFSEMALSVMYGENCFRLENMNYTIDDGYVVEEDAHTVHIETLRHGAWPNLRDLPHIKFGNNVSPIDCLDMISQTSSGQTFLKRLVIDFDSAPWLRVMDGVLIRILKRMRALQSVKLDFNTDWEDTTCEIPLPWDERLEGTARDFLLLIREELSHIKMITIGWNAGWTEAGDVETWMVHELKKRNEAWAPPLPRYKKFRRTISPLAIMDTEIAISVVHIEKEFKPKHLQHSLIHLERKHAVF